MVKISKGRKLPVLLVALFFAATSSIAATDITGVTGTGGVYNIDPTKNIGSIGFRKYQNFTLDNGDTANLRFDTGMNKFVNMVDNVITINGLVNTVNKANGNFNNGEAVFISPNGMTVGNSGVLNVGSLSVYTPTVSGMKMLKDGVDADNLTTTYKGQNINLLEAMSWHGNAPVTINGQVISHGDVNMVANTYTLTNNGKIGAGFGGTEKVDSSNAATLFNTLVNAGATNNIANINIRSYDRANTGASSNVGAVNLNGTLKNMGKGDITATNRGSQGLNVGIDAALETKNGKLQLVNGKGNMQIVSGADVKGAGDAIYLTNGANAGTMTIGGTVVSTKGVQVYNKANSGMTLNGTITNSGAGLAITNEKGAMNLNGNITNTAANMDVTNKGSGITVGNNAVIASSGKMQMYNTGDNGINVNGRINNSASTAITNTKGDFTVAQNAQISTTANKLNLTNKGNGALKVNGTVTGSGQEVLVQNVGDDGLVLNGTINNKGRLFVQNTKGAMVVNGHITGSTNTDAGNDTIYVGNTGSSLTVGNNAGISGNGTVQLVNTGANGMTVNGTVNNYHTNSAVKGTSLMNSAGNLAVNGTVQSSAGNINVTNKGNQLTVGTNGKIAASNGNVTVQNTGADGLDVSGRVEGKGTTYLYNTAGDLDIKGTVQENGRLFITNKGDKLNVASGATVTATGANAKISMLNTGNDGMTVNGTVTGAGKTLITNKKGNLNVGGTVNNTGGTLRLWNTNTGNALNVASDARITNDTNKTVLLNQGAGGMTVAGDVTTQGNIIATNKAGGMNVSGDVTSTAKDAVLTNTGSANTVVNGTVKGRNIKVVANGNDVVLGNTTTKQLALDAANKVRVENKNGSIKNAGVDADLIKAGGNLFMSAKNGSIGEDVDTSGIGAANRDLTKSVNIDVDGRIKAFTKDSNHNKVINLATKGKDMNVNRIKADGKVILLTDKDAQGHTGSILNDATQLNKFANVKGTSLHMISSGTIGTNAKPLHFRQTNANEASNVLANGNIILHARGEAQGEDVKFNYIQSKTGNIEADLIKNHIVEHANVSTGKSINITSRKNADVHTVNESHTLIRDYFDE